MKKLINFVRKSLSISPAEARGVVIILGAMILMILVPFASDYFFSQKQASAPFISPKVLDSLTVVLDGKQTYSSENTSPNTFNHSSAEGSNVPVKYFMFNPNTATVEQLQSLGVPKFLANRIAHYRSKGGKFRKKEDLAKIYDFSDDLYQRLAPYILLPAAENESVNFHQRQFSTASHSPEKIQYSENEEEVLAPNKPAEVVFPKSNYTKKNPQKFDMNVADTTAFKNISGIGSGYARRIIKFRESLGGFADANQVKEVFGFPPETAEELLKYGFVKSSVKRLKINELSVENLKHPYLRFYQSKAIVAYREQHGVFKSADDLKNIKVLDAATIEKIKPYLEF